MTSSPLSTIHYPLIIDRALPDPVAVRTRALAARYAEIPLPGEPAIKRVSLQPIPELIEAVASTARLEPRIAALRGRPVATGFRLDYGGELPNDWVHTDVYGRFAAVLYLNLPEHCRGGTAFWRHRPTGIEHLLETGPARAALIADAMIAGLWEQTRLIPMVFNRLILYPSALFHSRWPWPAFGSSPEDGRLIAMGFFN